MSKKMLDWIDRFDLEEVYGIDYETCLTMYDVAREGMVPLNVLKNLYMQHHGYKNHWCGEWQECKSCKSFFANGGNWTSKIYEDTCPYCEAEKAIKESEGEDE